MAIPNSNPVIRYTYYYISVIVKSGQWKCEITWQDSFGLDSGGIVAPMLQNYSEKCLFF